MMDLVPRRGFASAAASSTIARSAAATGIVILSRGIGEFAFHIIPDWLENHVEIALHAKSRSQRCEIELMRTEVVDNGRPAIEERLNVDQLPRPVPLA